MEVDNPAEMLRNAEGTFEVTSPFGHVFHVTCRPGTRMSVSEISEPKRVQAPDGMIWRIRKLAVAAA